jgi:TetR/AcrR family tetracycline transcriptional repressor
VNGRPIERDAIVAHALILLRREGLEGVTFRKLMTRLNVKAPAIYWRFAGKQDLLEAMAEKILQEAFSNLAPGAHAWQNWLSETMHQLRVDHRRRPPPNHPNAHAHR